LFLYQRISGVGLEKETYSYTRKCERKERKEGGRHEGRKEERKQRRKGGTEGVRRGER